MAQCSYSQHAASDLRDDGTSATSCARSTVYVYQTLEEDHIRVLELFPGQFGAPLKATLQHLDSKELPQERPPKRWPDQSVYDEVAQHPFYEAISYVWGPPIYDQTIEIAGCGILNITSSLYWALQYLRHEHRQRRLWADAICINQLDLAEKGKQVMRMKSVFRQARRVLIWLGPEEPGDELAFAVMDAYAACQLGLNREQEVRWEVEVLRAYFLGVKAASGRSIDVFEGLFAYTRLLVKPWWSRLWVVQEVEPFGESWIVCGNRRASWDCFENLRWTTIYAIRQQRLQWPSNMPLSWTTFEASATFDYEVFGGPAGLWTIKDALQRIIYCSGKQCSVAHDRIYAFYEWMELWRSPGLEPNYTQSATELYRVLVLAVFQYFKEHKDFSRVPYCLLALSSTEDGRSKESARPSWVPHFHFLTERSRAKFAMHSNGGSWHSSGQFQSNWSQVLECNIPNARTSLIRFRGKCFASVTRVLQCSIWPDDNSPLRILQWYLSCKNFVLMNTSEGGFDGREWQRLFLSGLELGTTSTDRPTLEMLQELAADCGSPTLELTESDQRVIALILAIGDGSALHHVGEMAVRYLDRTRKLCSVATSNGEVDIGWVPGNAKEGDELCAFAGSRFPFLLRRSELSGHYVVLGDAWTLRTMVKDVIGNDRTCPALDECQGRLCDWCNDWTGDVAHVQNLIAKLGWITLE